VTDDEIARRKRAEELREEIERLRSSEGPDEPPSSPREFVEEATREEAEREVQRSQEEDGSGEES
jgi:hypothetical protein